MFQVSHVVVLYLFIDQTAKEVPLLTPLEKALQWAEKGESDFLVESFVPSREERLSFAALQPIAGNYCIQTVMQIVSIGFCTLSHKNCYNS
jgi:hypothetical protein